MKNIVFQHTPSILSVKWASVCTANQALPSSPINLAFQSTPDEAGWVLTLEKCTCWIIIFITNFTICAGKCLRFQSPGNSDAFLGSARAELVRCRRLVWCRVCPLLPCWFGSVYPANIKMRIRSCQFCNMWYAIP